MPTTPRPFDLRVRSVLAVLLLLGAGVACDLDLQNPNAATEEEVLSDLDGVIAATVGIQDLFASNIADFVQGPALITDEWGTRSLALLAWTSLLTGESFDDSYGTVEAPWAAAYQVIGLADRVIAAAPDVAFSPSFGSAVLATAHLFRGMALGQLYLQYPYAPLDLDIDNPPAVDRQDILLAALDALDEAAAEWAATDPAQLGGFNTRVKGSSLDLGATIDAMRARFNLFAGNWQAARDAAAAVPADVLSAFDYAGTDQNPIYDLSFDAGYIAGLASFVADAEPGDKRPAFWIDLDAAPPQSNTDSALVQLRRYAAPTDPFPVFLPDEMTLIRAEAAARLGDLSRAADLVNQVRTQCSSALPEPTACLPALPDDRLDTLDEVLRQVTHERRYELYSQALRWEDLRRLGEYTTATAWRAFLPIPLQECIANTSISC